MSMSREKMMKYGGIILLVIVILLIIYWLYRRNTKTPTYTGKPVINMGDAKIVLIPDSSGTTSNYRMIEYATGTTSADNVNIEIIWTNGAGFSYNKVNKLIFKRYIGDKEVSPPVETTIASHIADFGGGSVTFYGRDLNDGENGVGDNHFKVFYTTEDGGDSDTFTPPPEELLSETTSPVTITQTHLDSTVNIDSITQINVPVTTGTTLYATLSTDDISYTLYSIASKNGGFLSPSTGGGYRARVLGTGQIEFMDQEGNPKDIAQLGTSTFYVSDYKDHQILHYGDINSGTLWVYNGSGNNLTYANTATLFKTQAGIDTALFTIAPAGVGTITQHPCPGYDRDGCTEQTHCGWHIESATCLDGNHNLLAEQAAATQLQQDKTKSWNEMTPEEQQAVYDYYN